MKPKYEESAYVEIAIIIRGNSVRPFERSAKWLCRQNLHSARSSRLHDHVQKRLHRIILRAWRTLQNQVFGRRRSCNGSKNQKGRRFRFCFWTVSLWGSSFA